MKLSTTVKATPTNWERSFRLLGTRTSEAAEVALYREAEHEMTISRRLVPVDTGTLRASAQVMPPEKSMTGMVTVRMGYGGPGIDYALRVHEDLEMHHVVGQAKFLEGPVRQEVGSGRAAARIETDIRRGIT